MGNSYLNCTAFPAKKGREIDPRGIMATQATQETTTQPSAAVKRKRKAPVSTAPRLQAKTLLIATRDELRDIQTELMELADKRRELLALDKRGTKSSIKLLPPKL